MRPSFNKKKLIFIPFAAAAFLALVGFVVMNLWNYLLPGILHVTAITFWQALGIFVLCKILFGFGRGGHRMHGGAPWMRNKMEERFKNMSPEEREKFKAKMKDHFCDRGRWGRNRGNRFDDKWDNFTAEPEGSKES